MIPTTFLGRFCIILISAGMYTICVVCLTLDWCVASCYQIWLSPDNMFRLAAILLNATPCYHDNTIVTSTTIMIRSFNVM